MVWSSSLTCENKNDLDRVQKSALRIILGKEYNNYNSALNRLNLLSLEERRKQLCINFAKKCTKNDKLNNMFPLNEHKYRMKTRQKEIFKVFKSKTERLKKSALFICKNCSILKITRELSFDLKHLW